MRKGYFYRLLISRLIPFLSRHPSLVIFAGILYLILPVDFLPELFTGLFGYIDDILALAASMFIAQQFQKKGRDFKVQSQTKQPLNPYETLGLNKGATKEEITKAYRKKMAEYHPDKVAHLGDDLKKTAHEKTMEIQAAYEQLLGGK